MSREQKCDVIQLRCKQDNITASSLGEEETKKGLSTDKVP